MWFRTALRMLRPELLAKAPQAAVELLLGSKPQCVSRLGNRDPGEYSDRPLEFLA